jgi:hypothetical protein
MGDAIHDTLLLADGGRQPESEAALKEKR